MKEYLVTVVCTVRKQLVVKTDNPDDLDENLYDNEIIDETELDQTDWEVLEVSPND